jgi:hypothetical protein
MKLIKTLITLSLVAVLASCSESVPEKVDANNQSYDWKKWECYEFGYGGKYLLTIGYIPELPKIDGFSPGKLFLKDSDSAIDTVYRLNGVQHYWNWDDFQIVIDSDGTGRFYDFTGAQEGEERQSREVYECTSSDLEKFNQFMESIW